jgi:hypothetical protein
MWGMYEFFYASASGADIECSGKALTRAVKQIRVAWKPATPHRAHNIVFHVSLTR